MDHLTDGDLAAYLDGEIPDDHAERVRSHLRSCDRCAGRRRELADVSSRLDEALERGLEPPEGISGPEVSAGAAAGSGPAPGGGEAGRVGFGGASAWRTAAAVAVLVVAGSVAVDAALPGSPIRDLFVEVVRPWEDGADGSAASADSAAAPRPDERRGLAVSPVEGRIGLAVRDAPRGTRVRVERIASSRARISAPGGRFRTDPGRLELVGPTGGEVRVEVPRSVESWQLDVNGRTVLRGTDAGVARADSAATERAGGGWEVVAGPR